VTRSSNSHDRRPGLRRVSDSGYDDPPAQGEGVQRHSQARCRHVACGRRHRPRGYRARGRIRGRSPWRTRPANRLGATILTHARTADRSFPTRASWVCDTSRRVHQQCVPMATVPGDHVRRDGSSRGPRCARRRGWGSHRHRRRTCPRGRGDLVGYSHGKNRRPRHSRLRGGWCAVAPTHHAQDGPMATTASWRAPAMGTAILNLAPRARTAAPRSRIGHHGTAGIPLASSRANTDDGRSAGENRSPPSSLGGTSGAGVRSSHGDVVPR